MLLKAQSLAVSCGLPQQSGHYWAHFCRASTLQAFFYAYAEFVFNAPWSVYQRTCHRSSWATLAKIAAISKDCKLICPAMVTLISSPGFLLIWLAMAMHVTADIGLPWKSIQMQRYPYGSTLTNVLAVRFCSSCLTFRAEWSIRSRFYMYEYVSHGTRPYCTGPCCIRVMAALIFNDVPCSDDSITRSSYITSDKARA